MHNYGVKNVTDSEKFSPDEDLAYFCHFAEIIQLTWDIHTFQAILNCLLEPQIVCWIELSAEIWPSKMSAG